MYVSTLLLVRRKSQCANCEVRLQCIAHTYQPFHIGEEGDLSYRHSLLTFLQFLSFRNVAAVVGSLYLLRKVFPILSALWFFSRAYLLAPCGIFRTNLKKYGSWAGKLLCHLSYDNIFMMEQSRGAMAP